ncbi:hypothetical protein FOA52_010955 [Chlamydomonas sp. UWO 241]|nr:hypothetical protein FOA52_010955 [Chlamydomonas sp. UWO 241]
MAKSKLGSLLKAKHRGSGAPGGGAAGGGDNAARLAAARGSKRPAPHGVGSVAGGKSAKRGVGQAGGGSERRRFSANDRSKESVAATELEVNVSEALGGSSSAYEALVGQLSVRDGALRQRRLEEQGLDSESEEETGGSELEEEEQGAHAGRGSDSEGVGAGSASDGEAGEGDGGDSENEDDSEGVHDDAPLDTWTLRGMRALQASGDAPPEAAAALPKGPQAGGKGEAGGKGGGGGDVDAGLPDPWAAHLGAELGSERLEALAVGPPGKLKDMPDGCELRKLGGRGVRWAVGGGRGEVPCAPPTLSGAGVKERLRSRWAEVGAGGAPPAPEADPTADADPTTSGRSAAKPSSAAAKAAAAAGEFASPAQRAFFGALSSYADVAACARQYPTADVSAPAGSELRARDEYMDAYLLHALNHVAKTADRIKKNNDKLEAAKEKVFAERKAAQLAAALASGSGAGEGEGAAGAAKGRGKPRGKSAAATAASAAAAAAAGAGNDKEGGASAASAASGSGGLADMEAPPRDQGFTRPKVLILLPQRNYAFVCVRRLVQLAMRETRADSVQNKEKFVDQFGPPEAEEPQDDSDERARARRAIKPSEWRAMFSGNLDDHFRLGIKMTRGSIRLFADLFQADIIVASPIALATKLAEDLAANGGKASSQVDFLSSIELLIIDRADMMSMQNWAHVETVVDALNRLPREQHGTDIMRVREWCLSGHARHYRQTVLLSSFLSPDMSRMLSTGCANHAGIVRAVAEHAGLLGAVVPKVQQLFERFRAPTPADVSTARFEHFKRTVWPRMKEAGGTGQVMFIPSYFDFVRVRNFLATEDAEFASVCEYTPPPDVTAARSRFFHGHRRLLLYTERAHFYNRHRVRGIRDVLFYGIPEHAHFYPELLNLLETDGLPASIGATVSVLFCRYDLPALERVVGSTRAQKMIAGDSNTFMFC